MSRRQKQPIKRKTPLSHREAALVHVWRRAWQRFGLALSVADLKELESKLISGKGKWVMDQKMMRVVYDVPFRERRLICVFDVSLWSIVTVLPGVGFLKGLPDER